MNTQTMETFIDTVGLRIEHSNLVERDDMFNSIMDFLKHNCNVGIKYDKAHSSKYYQRTNILYGNSKIAVISKGYFIVKSRLIATEYYYINIGFYGLKRYSNTDEKSNEVLMMLSAYLNTNNIHFVITELDIAMDMFYDIDDIQVVCTRRIPNVNYYPLGKVDNEGNNLQPYSRTYYIEKFKSYKQQKNAISRAYYYDKQYKELVQYNNDINKDITRFELKLQKRFFVKYEYSITSYIKVFKKYHILYFKDMKLKQQFINEFNSIKTARQRKKLVKKFVNSDDVLELRPIMKNIGTLLRNIDTITFDNNLKFVYTKQEDYLYTFSKFNRRWLLKNKNFLPTYYSVDKKQGVKNENRLRQNNSARDII